MNSFSASIFSYKIKQLQLTLLHCQNDTYLDHRSSAPHSIALTELCFNDALSFMKYCYKKQSKEICICYLKNTWVDYRIYHSTSPIKKSPLSKIYSRTCCQENNFYFFLRPELFTFK